MRVRADHRECAARDGILTAPALCTRSRIPQGGNGLGPEGMRHLSGALEMMTGMQALDLVCRLCFPTFAPPLQLRPPPPPFLLLPLLPPGSTVPLLSSFLLSLPLLSSSPQSR